MNEREEIEVEVVEVVNRQPASGSKPAPSSQPKREAGSPFSHPFVGRFSTRSLRIPAYLWPLVFILGLILLLLAAVIGLLIVIPFLIIRAIVRLLLGPSR